MMQPMLAQALSIEDISRKASDYIMEPKLDGIRCLASWDGRMYSRSAKTDLSLRLPHIAHAVKCLNLPQGCWLDGEVGYVQSYFHELYKWPILDFNATVRVTGSQPQEALRKQRENQDTLQFFVFDLIDEGVDQAQKIRTEDVLDTIDGPQEDGLWVIHAVSHVHRWDEDLYNQYVMQGAEGVILKNPLAAYQSGKRPARHWYKIKKFDSVDGQIVGFDPGMGKYEGQVGALVVQTQHPDYITVRCSGFDDALRQDMTNRWDVYSGRWVEVKHYGRVGEEGAGSYRHPQFLRFRPDLETEGI